MIDVGKLIAKYTLTTEVALFLGWMYLQGHETRVQAAVAEVDSIKQEVNTELRQMTKQTARVEAMLEALLMKEGIAAPSRAEFEPAVDSIDVDSTEADTT